MNETLPVQTQRQYDNIPESASVRLVVKALTDGIDGNADKKDGIAPDGTALHHWLLSHLSNCERSIPEREFRDASQEDYAFYAGDQDDADVKEKLAAERRPLQTFNEIRPKIDMLIGLAAQSRREPTLLPVGNEDETLAQLMNGAFKHYRYQLKLSRLEMEVFDDTVKGGRSLLHYYIDDENPFKPTFKAVKIDSWSFWLDPDSTAYDMSDARFLYVDKWVDKEIAWTRWPGQFPIPEGLGRPYDMPMFYNEMNEKFRIVECWYRKTEPVVWFVNPLTGKPEWAKPDDFKLFCEACVKGVMMPSGQMFRLPRAPKGVSGFRKFTYYAIFNGSKILERGENPYKHNMFPYVLCGGYKDRTKNTWFGAVKTMKDPQRSLNTLRRQLLHLLQTAPRGILMHEAGAIINIEEYETRSAHPTYHMELTPGGMGKVQFSKQPQISPVYSQQDDVMSQAMKNTSGIQDSLLGIQTSSREPGVTVKMRQETGIAVLFTLFDNFREFRINSGKMLLSLIQQFVDEPTMIRIEGPEGMQLLQANTQLNPDMPGFNDLTAAEFDLRVDETMESASIRAATAQMLTDMNHNDPGAIPPELILDYAGLPWTVRQQITQYRQQAQQAQEAQQQAQWDHEILLAKIKAHTEVMTTGLQTSTQKEIADGNRSQAAGERESGNGEGSGNGTGQPARKHRQRAGSQQ